MNPQTGDVYTSEKDIYDAVTRGVRLVGIPKEYEKAVLGMSRKERRAWYRKNKKRLNLPEWGTTTPSHD